VIRRSHSSAPLAPGEFREVHAVDDADVTGAREQHVAIRVGRQRRHHIVIHAVAAFATYFP